MTFSKMLQWFDSSLPVRDNAHHTRLRQVKKKITTSSTELVSRFSPQIPNPRTTLSLQDHRNILCPPRRRRNLDFQSPPVDFKDRRAPKPLAHFPPRNPNQGATKCWGAPGGLGAGVAAAAQPPHLTRSAARRRSTHQATASGRQPRWRCGQRVAWRPSRRQGATGGLDGSMADAAQPTHSPGPQREREARTR
jgi:hypothetical protein